MRCPHCDLIAAEYQEVRSELRSINEKLEKIMSEDAAVAAVVADENTQITNLTASDDALQSLIQALRAEVSAGTALQPATLQSLQAAEAALDTVAQQAAADVAADQPPAPPAS